MADSRYTEGYMTAHTFPWVDPGFVKGEVQEQRLELQDFFMFLNQGPLLLAPLPLLQAQLYLPSHFPFSPTSHCHCPWLTWVRGKAPKPFQPDAQGARKSSSEWFPPHLAFSQTGGEHLGGMGQEQRICPMSPLLLSPAKPGSLHSLVGAGQKQLWSSPCLQVSWGSSSSGQGKGACL